PNGNRTFAHDVAAAICSLRNECKRSIPHFASSRAQTRMGNDESWQLSDERAFSPAWVNPKYPIPLTRNYNNQRRLRTAFRVYTTIGKKHLSNMHIPNLSNHTLALLPSVVLINRCITVIDMRAIPLEDHLGLWKTAWGYALNTAFDKPSRHFNLLFTVEGSGIQGIFFKLARTLHQHASHTIAPDSLKMLLKNEMSLKLIIRVADDRSRRAPRRLNSKSVAELVPNARALEWRACMTKSALESQLDISRITYWLDMKMVTHYSMTHTIRIWIQSCNISIGEPHPLLLLCQL
ncbi:Hypothetical predicted protein, partial [Paramuricea clavata]